MKARRYQQGSALLLSLLALGCSSDRAPSDVSSTSGPAASATAQGTGEGILAALNSADLSVLDNVGDDERADDARLFRALAHGSGSWSIERSAIGPDEQFVGLFVNPERRSYLIGMSRVDEANRLAFQPIETAERIAADSENVVFIASDLDGDCKTLSSTGDPAVPVPLASVSKLAIVGTLARQIEAGEMTLGETVSIGQVPVSLKSGTWQFLAPETVRSVEQAVDAIFLQSDNTAADLLLNAVGREAVGEYSFEQLGTEPADPFLRTSEVFKLSWGEGTRLKQQYLDAEPSARLAILEELNDVPLPQQYEIYDDPVPNPFIGWTGSLEGLCSIWSDILSSPLADQVQAASLPNSYLTAINDLGMVGIKDGFGPNVSSISMVVENRCGHRVALSSAVIGQAPADWKARSVLLDRLQSDLPKVQELGCSSPVTTG